MVKKITAARTFFILLTLGVIGSVTLPQASAIDRGDLGTVGPENTHLELAGTPMAGVTPIQGGSSPFATFRPPACRAATYCDAMQFEVDYPSNFLREVFFGVNITLTWDNPYHSEKNPSGNDLDLFVWGDDGAAAGGPSGECGSPLDDVCDNVHPESMSIIEPPNTVPEDAEPSAVYLTVVNHQGVNTGYKLTVDWFTFDIEDAPKFTPPQRQRSGQDPFDVTRPPPSFDVTESTGAGGPTPEPTPRKILVPGPDGKFHEVELPLYGAGQRLSSSSERDMTSTWVFAAIVGVVVLAALVFVLVRRNRQAMDQL